MYVTFTCNLMLVLVRSNLVPPPKNVVKKVKYLFSLSKKTEAADLFIPYLSFNLCVHQPTASAILLIICFHHMEIEKDEKVTLRKQQTRKRGR